MNMLSLHKIIAVILVSLTVVLMLYPGGVRGFFSDEYPRSPLTTDNTELYLLRVEHYLVLTTSTTVGVFHVRFVFPPVYGFQTPLLLEIVNDSTAEILQYHIENDTSTPNLIVNFTIGYLEADDQILLHFSCWALVENHDFSDLPCSVEFPDPEELPVEATTWLTSTSVVQAESLLIRQKARQLRGISPDLLRFAERVAWFIKHHRYLFFVIALNLGLLASQDAVTTLLVNGENVGRSHLACALFRSQGVPARVLLAHNDQGFWTQMHYMTEYYCPDYGWVLLDPTKGETPYETKRQVIHRICYPADEEDTKPDYIFPFMRGEERWLWINTPSVQPYYVDCDQGSKSQMFTKASLITDTVTGAEAVLHTQHVFLLYQRYLGVNLSGENQDHFTQAVQYQHDAITAFQTMHDLGQYIQLLDDAYTHYMNISL